MAAKIEAELSANIAPFRRELEKATEKLREFGAKAKEIGTDILKETGGHDMAKMLGLGGATVAITAFGVALVEAVHKGLEAYGEFEQRVLKTELNVPGITHEQATERTEADDKLAGAPGTAADIGAAKTQLREAGLAESQTESQKAETPSIGGVSGAHMEGNITVLPAVTKALEQMHTVDSVWKDLANYQVKSGVNQVEAAAAVRKILERSGDTSENLSRLFSVLPGLGKEIQTRQQADKDKFLASLSVQERSHPSAATSEQWQKMEKQSPSDYYKEKGGGPNELLEMIHKLTKGDEVEKYSHTLQGVMADVAARFELLNTAIGAALAPDLEKMMHEFAGALPEMTTDIGEIAKSVLPAFHDGLTNCTKLLADLYQKFSPSTVIDKDVALTKSGKYDPDTNKVNYDSPAYKGWQGVWDALWDDASIHLRKSAGMLPEDLSAVKHTEPGGRIRDPATGMTETLQELKESKDYLKNIHELLAQSQIG